jgi:hypothetical protein
VKMKKIERGRDSTMKKTAATIAKVSKKPKS